MCRAGAAQRVGGRFCGRVFALLCKGARELLAGQALALLEVPGARLPPLRWSIFGKNDYQCRNTKRCRMKPMEQFLTVDEMARLNAMLTRDEFWCPLAVAPSSAC